MRQSRQRDTRQLTPAQQRIIDRVRSGRLTSVETSKVDGQIVERLIDKGVLGYRNKTILPVERTFHGRHIPGDRVYQGLYVLMPGAS